VAYIALLSASFGDYHLSVPRHAPAALLQQLGVAESVMVSDVSRPLEGWHNVIADLGASPRLSVKIVKCLPQRFTTAEFVLWIDAQVHVVSSDFATFCLDHLGDGEIAVMRHHSRDSLLDEGMAGSLDPRFEGQDPLGQAKHYVESGHPDRWWLPWTSILMRRMTPRVLEFGRRWLDEQQKWSTHDQVSFPPLCRTILGEPREIPFPTGLVQIDGYLPSCSPERPRNADDPRS
jgi:hypothetical protein